MKNLLNTNIEFRTDLADELEYAFELDNVESTDWAFVLKDMITGKVVKTKDRDNAIKIYAKMKSDNCHVIIKEVPWWYIGIAELEWLCIESYLCQVHGKNNVISIDDGFYRKPFEDKVAFEDGNRLGTIYIVDKEHTYQFCKNMEEEGCAMYSHKFIPLYDRDFLYYEIVPVTWSEDGWFNFHR